MQFQHFSHWAWHTALLTLQVLLATALFALLLMLAERHNRRFDLTPTQSFVLSDAAQQIVEGIQVPIRLTVFYNSQEQGRRRQMDDMLQLFSTASSNFTYRLLDLDRSPALAKKYGISSFNTGVMETDGKTRQLRGIGQESITEALLRLTRQEKRTLCFVTGHGEQSPQDSSDRSGYSEVAKALEKEHFEIRTLDAVPQDGVPTDCSMLILAGPSQDLLAGEADQMARYIDTGGRMLFMIDPDAPQSVVQFVARYGVRAGNDIVVDERNRFYGADSFMPRVPIFDEGTFENNLDTAAVFSVARTITPAEDSQNHIAVLLLALTSDESWARVNGGEVPDGEVQFRRELDRPGPLPVAVMVTAKYDVSDDRSSTDEKPSIGRMIVFGDSDFASNLYLNLLGNKDLFMSSIGVLAEDEKLIAMRRKGMPRSSLSPIWLTATQGRLIFWMAVIVQPAGCAVLGLLITWRRRRRGSL